MQILIVDDNVDIRFTLKEIFESKGYSVVTATDGDEALSMSPADVTILDLGLEFYDGTDLIEQFNNVIVYTGHDVKGLKSLVLDKGAVDFIAKDDLNGLLAAVAKLAGETT